MGKPLTSTEAMTAWNACDRLRVEPGELEELVGRLLDTRGEALSQLADLQAKVGPLVEAGNRAAELLEAFHPDTGDGCIVEADIAALRAALADWEEKP